MKIGDKVSFRVPYAGGSFDKSTATLPKTRAAAGSIDAIKPDGSLVVRMQQGGFATIKPAEVVEHFPR